MTGGTLPAFKLGHYRLRCWLDLADRESQSALLPPDPANMLSPKRVFVGKAFTFSLLTLLSLQLTVSAETNPVTIYDEAISAYKGGRYDQAMQSLDQLETLDLKPSTRAEARNLRALIFMRECEYDSAEAFLHQALELEPSLFNAKFNLGEISFVNRNWGEARKRFESLLLGENGNLESDVRELIRFKIFLTLLLERKNGAAEEMMRTWEQSLPAAYYAHAAIARNQGHMQEATRWRSDAQTNFAAATTNLYLESFYEIGWEERPVTQPRKDFEIPSATERATRTELDAGKALASAREDVSSGHLERALASIAQAEKELPKQGFSHNLRAEILMKQGKLDEAENELQKALALTPKLSEASYNLAAIYFKRKQFSKAREELEKLFSVTRETQSQQFLRYKVFLTFLLEGSDYQAELMMKKFTYTAETPALYYAQAAWSFHHGQTEDGNDWIQTARRIYSPELNLIFADDFYPLRWLSGPVEKTPSLAESTSAASSTDPYQAQLQPITPTNWTFETGLMPPALQFTFPAGNDLLKPLPPLSEAP